MKYRYYVLSVLAAGALMAQQRPSSSTRAQDSSTARPPSFGEYKLVVDRNIFSKSRRPQRSYFPSNDRPRQTRGALHLTGIVIDQGDLVISIEDTRTNRTERYRVGDKVGDGVITGAGLDYIEFSVNGHVSRYDVGSTIENGPRAEVADASPSAPTSQPSSAGGATGGTVSRPPSSYSGDSADILEKLRQKRLQETKK